METSPRRGGGLRPIRLGDIPLEIRLRARDRLLRGVDPKLPRVGSFEARLELGAVAERPSDRVYWIPRQAYERVMLPKNRRTP